MAPPKGNRPPQKVGPNDPTPEKLWSPTPQPATLASPVQPSSPTPKSKNKVPGKMDIGKIFWASTQWTPKASKSGPGAHMQVDLNYGDEVNVVGFREGWAGIQKFDLYREAKHKGTEAPTAWVPFETLTEGWSPSAQKLPSGMLEGRKATAVRNYVGNITFLNGIGPDAGDQIHIHEGRNVELNKVSSDGRWAYARLEDVGLKGWIPSSCLKLTRWPFIAIESFDPELERKTLQSGRKYVPLKKNDRGYILREVPGWFEVALPYRTSGPRQGWVPGKRISSNKETNWGEFDLMLQSLKEIKISGQGQVPIYDTAKALMKSFQNLTFLGGGMGAIINNPDAASDYATALVNGMRRAATFGKFSSPSFTSKDFFGVETAQPIGKGFKHDYTCVYLIAYSGFPDGGCARIYGGHTMGLSKRTRSHYSVGWNEKRPYTHYVFGRKAKKSAVIPFCILDRQDPTFGRIIEQLVMCLFSTYHEKIIPFGGAQVKITTARLNQIQDLLSDDEGDDEDEDNIAQPEPEDSSSTGKGKGKAKSKKAQRLEDVKDPRQRRALQAHHAAEIASCMKPALESTGWKLDKVDWKGLNISSPLGETDRAGKMAWVKYDLGDRWQFRRSHLICKKISSSNALVLRMAIMSGVGQFGLSTTVIPKAIKEGSKYWITAEIMKNQRPHPCPWALLPELGPWSDWASVFTLAFKLEYHDEEGRWFQHYFQEVENPLSLLPDYRYFTKTGQKPQPVSGSQQMYATVKGLLSYFLRQEFPSAPTWWLDMGQADVREVIFNPADPATQKIRLQIPPKTQKPAPVRVPDQVMINQLASVGAQNIGRTLNSFSAAEKADLIAEVDKRSGFKCDSCRLNQVVLVDKVLGARDPGAVVKVLHNFGDASTRVCKPSTIDPSKCGCCWIRGIPCSFTPVHLAYANIPLQKLLMPRGYINGRTQAPKDAQKKFGLKKAKLAYNPYPEEIPDPLIQGGISETLFAVADDDVVVADEFMHSDGDDSED
ncbi:hypothetical protein SLS58_002241 [Diplodia intermedia]|uniref:SH3 domain-containing protein n=1 Tax=Diplodia intermedia TaxID=856260 RepID=A0ABR3U009_9PEZI